ncbi:RNA-directed DNA polymerase [Glutamicibacter sp. ZJUTW]|uniref:RNA-directed DNA polymerase n=1 Tax=Glutamicibacter sp. ZJUTW TaxID=1155384 RepID=UPI0011F355A4|nr:RNA-directed DNA polymerase [Glutamicibacter sp. ZJUTW]QEP06377.1 RNA-directed DNA polymerase [Glutamicibacter sp. ZJUTW]
MAKQTKSELQTGLIPSVELVSMPKLGFGNRPLAVLSPQTRVVLEALIALLEDSLPPSSRSIKFQEFEAFGTEDHEAWLVDFDIAACYEFIDHSVLAGELILQGANSDAVEITRRTLGAVHGRQIGLPQGVASSHRLSDAYLDVIERSLTRHGYTVGRYADDFRVITHSRKEAFQVIDIAMEEARRVHLALAEQKIHVRKAPEIAADIKKRSGLSEEYTKRVYGDLAKAILVSSGYDDWEVELQEPDQEDVDFAAVKQLLSDWGDPDNARSRAMSHAGIVALSGAKSLGERIPNEILARIVDKEPVRLRKVMEYLLTRTAEADNWKLLNEIAAQERSTPWHKIWLFSTASRLGDNDSTAKTEFLDFASQQLKDSHEAVRLEAAWLLAVNEYITSEEVQSLYSRASRTSQIGLAAVAGRVSQTPYGKADKAIRNDSALNTCAFEWGESFGKDS